jgi:hypothetical protein
MHDIPADIRALEDALNTADCDAGALVAGLTEDHGAWRADAGLVGASRNALTIWQRPTACTCARCSLLLIVHSRTGGDDVGPHIRG